MRVRCFLTVFISLLLCGTSCSTFAQKGDTGVDLSPLQRQTLDQYFDKGVDNIERTGDSILFFLARIEEVPTRHPVKFYYQTTLKYLLAYKIDGVERTGEQTFEIMHWAKLTNEAGFIADAYGYMALHYKEIGATDSAVYFFDLALETASKIPDSRRVHRILVNYSSLLIKQGKKDEVLRYTMNSITYDSLYNQNLNQGNNYHLLGNIYLYSGDLPKALEAYQISYAAFEKNQNISKMIKVLNNIGLVHSNVGNTDLAEATYLELLNLIEINQLEKQKISVLINLGALYLEKGEFDKDIAMLNEAMAISEKYGIVRFQAKIQNNLGNVAYYQGDYAASLQYFLEALRMNENEGNLHEQALCQSNAGWAYLMLNDEKKCIESFTRALKLATAAGSDEFRMEALEGLADASEYFGNYKEALVYKNKFIALKDSLLGEKSKTKIAELQTLYDKEKREREIEELKQREFEHEMRIRENNLEISRLNWQRFGLSLGLFFVIVSSFFIWRIYRNKKENEKNKALLNERELGLQAVFDATEEERQRIARDLHDGIGQQMSGLKLAWENLTISANHLREDEKNKLKELSKILDATASEVREISHRMMPKVLSEIGLAAALQDMLEKSFGMGNIQYVFEQYNFNDRLPQKIEITLFRIAQELANNVIKHAKASSVNVQLFKNNNHVVLIFEDNGVGIQSNEQNSGHGFLNIQSRLSAIHGSFNLAPSFEKGSVATIRIQL
jgi:signal transduction histidine kinase/tetratricopeptide (TPR) repeat protein